MIVGIDIGTSYSSIAIRGENGQAEPVRVANGTCAFGDSFSLPSAIFVEEDGSTVIGQLAMTSRMKDPACFKGEFKRDLGQTEPFTLGNLQILPEDIYKEIFIYFKDCAEKAGGKEISKAYITHPANFSRKKIERIKKAAKRAGFLDIELIDEPTAAAFCYYAKGKIQDGDKLLVYDFGGGTFDVALIQYIEGGFYQITPALGIDRCGGVDIDRQIFEDIYNSIPTDTMEMIGNNETYKKRLTAQIMEASVRIKHELSTRPQVKETITVGWDTLNYQIDHAKLNQMIAPLVEETLALLRQILKNANLKAEEINSVLIVGGTSRIPYIQEKLKEVTGKPVSYDIDPELAVCAGAALWERNKKDIKADKIKTSIELALDKSAKEQYQLGYDYYFGKNNKKKNYEQAVYWLTKAAERGESQAYFWLGHSYNYGNGVSKDYNWAIYWYEKSAQEENSKAQRCLGKIYESRDEYEQAKFWYAKAAAQGDTNAIVKLERLQAALSDKSTDKIKTSISAEEQYQLGYDYYFGKNNQEKNYEQAVYWLTKAAERGISEAYILLGLCYRYGSGVTRDYAKAIYWYEKSAQEADSSAAKSFLGNIYESMHDNNQATYWYTKAAAQGDTDAIVRLGKLKAASTFKFVQKELKNLFDKL